MARGAQAGLVLTDNEDLSDDRISELRLAIHRGQEAKRTFVQSNLRLAVSVANDFKHHGVPLADLIQEGTFGLIGAVEKFDYTKGFKFSTYAMWSIRQSIQRA